MRKTLLLLALTLCLATLSARTLTGKVTAIKDGDTIVVLKGKTTHTIRLDGIDCPEKKQAFGARARQFTAHEVFGKKVRVEYQSLDRYQRILGTVFYENGQNLNQELLKAGLAWHYKAYNKDIRLANLENTARSKRLGLWAEKQPVPPWKFRRKK